MKSILQLPIDWQVILKSLKEKLCSFQKLLEIGIPKKKVNEILLAMEQLGMVHKLHGFQYALLVKRGDVKGT